MKTQILVINGGNTFDKHEEYVRYLKTRPLTLGHMRSNDWKGYLQNNLGNDFDVLLAQMPNNRNARYEEWKIWFERIIPLLNEEAIFIGHSLGGIFLAKYFSENDYPKKVIATILIAAPFNTPSKHPLADFNLSDDMNLLKKFEQQGGKILIFQSKDDQIVPYSNCEDYKNALPSANLLVFENYQHFNQQDFPEIVDSIRNLTRNG